MDKEQFDINKVHVGRTLEGTVFEVVTVLLIVISWTLSIVTSDGTLSSEDTQGRLFTDVVLSAIAILLLFVAYHPKKMNTTVPWRNISQVRLAVRMARVLALEMALMLLFVFVIFVHIDVPEWMNALPPIIFIGTAALFTVLMRRC